MSDQKLDNKKRNKMFKGLGQLGDMAKLMKQAQEMQQKMLDAQSELDNVEVLGEAGVGLSKLLVQLKELSKISK